MVGGRPSGEAVIDLEDVAYHVFVVLDSAGRLQVPGEYLEQIGIGDRATLEVTDEGILIRPVAGRGAAVSPPSVEPEEEESPVRQRRGLRGWWARVRKR